MTNFAVAGATNLELFPRYTGKIRRAATLYLVPTNDASKIMTINQHFAHQIRWVARNFAFNLDFVPADKWDWKPASTASSAQEITAHITETLHRAVLMMAGANWDEAESQMPSESADSLETAKAELHKAAESFAAQVETLTTEAEQRILHTPFGEFSVAQFAKIDLLDLIHHHGQIAYIQTLCGDTESHFVDGDF